MCKVFGLTNTSKITDHKKITDSILKHVSKEEQDGLGFEFVSEDGTRFGQRSTSPDMRFTMKRPVMPPNEFTIATSEKIGTYTGKTKGPAIFHSRTSTNEVSLRNTHPLRSSGFSLVHNGVVSDHGPVFERETSNDTEFILNYIKQENGLDLIQKNLTGYYACLVLTPDNKLRIFLDDQAPLWAAYCSKLETWVFSTCPDVIESVWKDIGLLDHLPSPYQVKENYAMLWDGNNLIETATIKPRGYGRAESSLAGLSLGRSLFDSTREYVNYNYGAKEYINSDAKLTKREIDFAELVRDAAYKNNKYTFINSSTRELFETDINAADNADLLEISIVHPDGSIIDINNFDIDSGELFNEFKKYSY